MDATAFSNLTDLAAASLGGKALLCSDDFFASMSNLLQPGRGVFIPDEYTDRGKWMDGWESRRKRVPGHDWCIIELGIPGKVRGVDIDTNHFLGNHAPFASLEACVAPPGMTPEALRDEVSWVEILSQVGLRAGSQNLFATTAEGPFTHVRLRIYPDGGVARLKVYGEPTFTPPRAGRADGEAMDLAAVANGGRALACSDMFFSPMVNLIAPGRAENMGGGWESRRRRGPGNDWIILQLATSGRIDRLLIDTRFFKGNFPDRCSVEGIRWPGAPPASLIASSDWETVLARHKLSADAEHEIPIAGLGPFTHLRLQIYPCGGVSRLRVHGRPDDTASGDRLIASLNAHAGAVDVFLRCCGSRRWAQAMADARPFVSRAHLYGAAEVAWWRLDRTDWLEAFAHHPKIGADVAKLREKFAATAELAAAEQAGVKSASEETLRALASGNRTYDETFGYTFIVCATGKSAGEMLALLEDRLGNSPDNELRIAAGEQARITRIRLEKLTL